MSLLKSRNRLVSFRLAPEEYSSVRQACVNIGARSVSDFARRALLSRVESGEVSLEGDLATIARQLKEVELALETTRALIARVLGSENPHPVEAASKTLQAQAAPGSNVAPGANVMSRYEAFR